MRRKKKAPLPLGLIVPCSLMAAVFAFTFFSPTSPLRSGIVYAAGTGANYAWSENIGWISFDSRNCDENSDGMSDATQAGCPPAGTAVADYRVYENVDGALSGYAWAESVGWISFNAADVANCPSGSCAPTVRLSDGNVSGWALACGSFDDTNRCDGSQVRAGGWEGWIHLEGIAADGSTYGPTQSTSNCTWAGWAWGGGNSTNDGVIGWVHFNDNESGLYQMSVSDNGSGCSLLETSTAVVELTASPAPGYADATNPLNISYPGASNDAVLTLRTAGVASCTAITGGNPYQTINLIGTQDYNTTVTKSATSINTHPENADGSVNAYPTSFTITCTPQDGSADVTATAPITVSGKSSTAAVCAISGFLASPSKVKKGTPSDLSWSSNNLCTTCSISGSDGSAYTDLQPSGSQETGNINQTTNFTLTCSGTGLDSASVSVGIEPTIIEI